MSKTQSSFRRGWSLAHPQTRKTAVRGLQMAYISQGRGYKGKFLRSGAVIAGSAGYHATRGQLKKRGATMAKKKSGSWSKGNAPAQGGTPHKMSKPEQGKLGRSSFKKGVKTAKGRKK